MAIIITEAEPKLSMEEILMLYGDQPVADHIGTMTTNRFPREVYPPSVLTVRAFYEGIMEQLRKEND